MSAGAPEGLDALTASFLQHKLAEFRLLSERPVPDFTALAVAAHRLRGTGGAYGFDALSELAALLEQAAQSRDVERARKALEQINQLIGRLVGG